MTEEMKLLYWLEISAYPEQAEVLRNILNSKNKLLEFVKYCTKQESYMKQFLNKHAIDFKDNLDSKATDLLKEIEELE